MVVIYLTHSLVFPMMPRKGRRDGDCVCGDTGQAEGLSYRPSSERVMGHLPSVKSSGYTGTCGDVLLDALPHGRKSFCFGGWEKDMPISPVSLPWAARPGHVWPAPVKGSDDADGAHAVIHASVLGQWLITVSSCL